MNGQLVSELERFYLDWMAKNIVPYLPDASGHRIGKTERCERGATVAWWALKEGIINEVGKACLVREA